MSVVRSVAVAVAALGVGVLLAPPVGAADYQFPSQVVEFGKDGDYAPEVALGSWEHPTRVTGRTLRESEEEDNRNLVKLNVPEGYRVQVGYTALPKDGAGGFFDAAGGFMFAPKLQYRQGGLMVDCPAHHGSGRGNFLETFAPISGYLVGGKYGADSPCGGEEVFLDLGMIRTGDFHGAVDVDLTLAAVPAEPEGAPAGVSVARQESELVVLSPQEHVVAVAPATQPDAAEELVGTTYGEILQGQTHYYAVPVAWGQVLDGTFEVLGASIGEVDEPARAVELQVLNSLGQPQELIGRKEIDVAHVTQPVTFGTAYPIAYANADAHEHNATSSWLAGTHVVAVTLSNITGAPTAEPLRYRLTLRPQGEAVAGPKLTSAKPTPPPEHPRASTSAAPVARTTGANPVLKVFGGGVAAAAVVITALMVFVKTRKS